MTRMLQEENLEDNGFLAVSNYKEEVSGRVPLCMGGCFAKTPSSMDSSPVKKLLPQCVFLNSLFRLIVDAFPVYVELVSKRTIHDSWRGEANPPLFALGNMAGSNKPHNTIPYIIPYHTSTRSYTRHAAQSANVLKHCTEEWRCRGLVGH